MSQEELTQEEKENIVQTVEEYCALFGSRNQSAATLGISPATLSAILTGKWEKVSYSMWNMLSNKIRQAGGGMKRSDGWQLHKSTAFQELTLTFEEAQRTKQAVWVVGDAGSGKTTAAKAYRSERRDVFYILCAEDMHRADFIGELYRAVGAHTDIAGVRGQFESVLSKLNGMGAPLLIFDEGDKLSESVFSYFVSIYNRLEGRAGIVFLSTAHIKRRMSNGLTYNKRGYAEIYSRIGRCFFDLTPATDADVYAIAQLNGLTNNADIKKVVVDADKCANDLRRVKQTVSRLRRIREIKTGEGNETSND